MTNIIVVLVLAGIVWAAYRFFFSSKPSKVDYSFGNEHLKKILVLVRASKYAEAETAFKQLDSNNLTQVCDYLALSLNEKTLMNFHDNSKDKSLSGLILGVYFSHAAWKARGNAYADKVSDGQADIFGENLLRASEYLKLVVSDPYYGTEANSRMVRVCMGLGEMTIAREYFHACRNKDINHLWNYIHYSELIQPKWGGDIKEISAFYETLPDNKLIKTIVRLKLMYDGYLVGQNYFDPEMDIESYYTEFKPEFLRLDAEGSIMNLPSVHKYIAIGYMTLIADTLGEKALFQKYWKLLNGNLPLYPFGIQ